jgi:ribosomal protein L37AE/L43A
VTELYAVQELDGAEHALEITAPEPGTTPCPRCSHPMELCTVQVGTQRLDGRIARCPRHGVFLPQAAMTAVFARASRAGRAGRGVGHAVGGTRTMGQGGGGMSAAMGSIASAFGGGRLRASSLAISNWKTMRPTVHTVYVSAFKDRPLPCPACPGTTLEYQGDRWCCASCSGAFVETAAFIAMASDMASAPWELPAPSGSPGPRPCPQCATPMLAERIAHGVWFDEHELEASLHRVASPTPTGISGWLRAIFS